MPKMKTHKGLRKRVKISARGKVIRRKSFSGHLMSKKSGAQRRKLRQQTLMVGKTGENVKRALGYK